MNEYSQNEEILLLNLVENIVIVQKISVNLKT